MQKSASGAQKRQPKGIGRQHRSQATGVVRSTGVAIGRLAGR